MSIYKIERQAFPDLNISILNKEHAMRWLEFLRFKFRIEQPISFCWVVGKDERLLGSFERRQIDCSSRWGIIELFEPYLIRTLGHEFCHFYRWVTHQKTGHLENWFEDLNKVHSTIRTRLYEP